MVPRPDLIDWFFGLSLFKQLAYVMLCGPLVTSAWALIAEPRRNAVTKSVGTGDDAPWRKAA